MRRLGALFGFFLAAELGTLLAWTGALAAYNALNVWLFTVYGSETSIAQVYDKLPSLWKRAFGEYFLSVNSLAGWLATQFFSFLPVLAGAYLVILTSSLFVADEESRAIVSLLTQPLRRGTIWAAKAATGLVCLVALLALNLGATLGALALFAPGAAPLATILRSYAMSGIFLLFLGSLFAALSLALRGQKAALAAGLGLLVLLFLLNMALAGLELPLWLRELNPFHYHDASRVVIEGSISAKGLLYWTLGAAILAGIGRALFARKQRL